ncbi:hypothetical protein ACH5RR_036844 [Cinchona calisaya]|uniref:WIT1/2 N-terminal helical bundle domain-containing protein n=1 Tax=Cinchona calisaya TaxID=153742 RepID=A0ABD2Y879_9GENT
MEEETLANPKVSQIKVLQDEDTIADPVKAPIKEKEGKKEEEETALDGEFIKVEKESLDVKDGSHAVKTVSSEDGRPSIAHESLRNSTSSREFLEAQEKAKELELELERVAAALKDSESQNVQLKDELSLTKGLLEEDGKKYEELELGHQKLQQQTLDAEERYSAQLKPLEEAVQSLDSKHKELIEVKEAFNTLTLESDRSNKKMEELEHELQTSVNEAQKFEELHKQSGSHAEAETHRAVEFERLLELAKVSAKEMEDQMNSLQEELKGLYEKIAENQKVEEALKTTTTELSTVQGELELSKSQLLELEQGLASKEVLVQELTQELDVRKASEAQVKEDASELQNLLSSTKEELQSKLADLEDAKLKLQEEVTAKEQVEVSLKNQDSKVSAMEKEVAKLTNDKEEIEAAVADLTSNISQMKELCSDLEAKLQQSDDNFCKADSLLSQALANSAELEQKLKTLEEIHHESGYAVDITNRKNLELEEIIRASSAAADEAKSQLREFESHCIASEQRSLELEQLLNLVELKSNDAERELRDSSHKISELNTTIEKAVEEKELLNAQIQESQQKVAALEFDLGKSTARHSELELELKNVTGKCAEHEEQANKIHQRRLELEDLVQVSHSKAEEASKKVSEFELLLETEKYRIQELEEQIIMLEKKHQDSQAESKNHSEKVSELEAELDAYKAKAASLEVALEMATEKEKELGQCLNALTEEKKILEVASKSLTEKLAEAEGLLEVLRNETNVAQEKLESLENDLRAAGIRETEFLEKLKSAEEQVGHHGKLLEQATARSVELESLHTTLSRDSETKLQEAIANFSSKDSEAKSLYEKLKLLEDQVKSYEEQLAESGGKYAALKEEVEQILIKLTSAENANEDLLRKISEAEDKSAQFSSENELLAETNVQLKTKVNELDELLMSASSEKEAAALQLASHMNTIIELTEQHSRASELQLATESRISEAETQLQEAIGRFTHRDLEAKDLIENLNALEGQVKAYEEQAHEASTVAESLKVELEQTLLKLRNLESVIEELQGKSAQSQQETDKLLEANIKLTEELASYESKVNDTLTKLTAALVEKDEAIKEVQLAKKTIEGLTQQLTSEGERLHSQISSVIEEKNMLTETHELSKKELQAVATRLEEQLKELESREGALNAEIETLKDEITQKSVSQNRLKELEEQLAAYEQKESLSQHGSEMEAPSKHVIEELEAKNKQVLFLETQVKELEQKLQLADAKSKEKQVGGISVESRDLGSSISTPSKRKSKKRSEASSTQTWSSETRTQSSEGSALMTFKFILGVALVSVIVGIILGKRY